MFQTEEPMNERHAVLGTFCVCSEHARYDYQQRSGECVMGCTSGLAPIAASTCHAYRIGSLGGTLTGEKKTCFLNSILKKSTGLFVQSKTRSEFSVWIAGTQSTKHVNSRTAVDHFFRTALTTPKDHIDSTQRALSKQQADAGRSEGRPAR